MNPLPPFGCRPRRAPVLCFVRSRYSPFTNASMRRIALTAAALVMTAAPLRAQAGGYTAARRAADSTQALAFFRGNIAAIHHRDRAAYLRHYLQSPRLARVGPGGVQYGYQPLAAQRDTTWPDTLVATHFEVIPLSPGVVYGTYRYRVAQ